MKTDQNTDTSIGFLQNLNGAVSKLKNRLQRNYEQAYPGLRDLIRIVLDEEEAKAWDLSFPHLFLPDLVEAHITRLGLEPVRDESLFAPIYVAAEETQQLAPQALGLQRVASN
jgi:hypothetical protein